ncbi:Diguanylate cyclase DosC [compost metagenome]
MTRPAPEQLAHDWANLLARFPAQVSQQVGRLAERQQQVLASHFYTQMLQDPAASLLLSHEQVKSRLHGSMQRWIANLFASDEDQDLPALIAEQTKIGEVHARIEVPVHLVLRGARSLKEKFHELLQSDASLDLDPAQRFAAARLVGELVDLAMEIMSHAYASSHERNSRAEEAYRLFSVAQNIGAEKERQRAALLDWENQLMFDLAVGLAPAQLPRIGAAEFGLWFRHKGAHAFQGSPEAQRILQAIECIDETLLPTFGLPDSSAEERVLHLRELREQSRSIGFHLDHLFEQANELEAGRDALTRLLNRKFLSVVLGKEMGYAQQHSQQFAVLAIDVDHFKQINDRHGHDAGDLVLQQLAVLLGNHSRGGDYVFRLGGEEFLMLLVDVNQAGALKAAEKLRQKVAQEVFRLPREQALKVSVSIGLALHDGHPDYLRLLRRADEALYRAKNGGRNCVALAEE